MTGEMSRSEVTPENFPIHFAIANALGGTVHPFDQYQGPYISNFPDVGAKLWLQAKGDGPGFQIYNSVNDKLSPVTYEGENLLQIEYAKRVMYGPRVVKRKFRVTVTETRVMDFIVEAESAEAAREEIDFNDFDSDDAVRSEYINPEVLSVEPDENKG